MILSDLAIVKTGFENADFWITRRSSVDRVGSVSREYNPEAIGVKVLRTDILIPEYCFYMMDAIHAAGHWKARATGTLQLVNIRVSDVRNIRLMPR